MKLKIFNRIFLSFLLFVVFILAVFWFFYLRGVTSNTRSMIEASMATDVMLIEREIIQFFTLKRTEIDLLSEMAVVRAFLHERGFFKTKVRGQLEDDLIDFAHSGAGIERIRIVETAYFATEPTLLDVQRSEGKFGKHDFQETMIIARGDDIEGGFEAQFIYATLTGDPFVAQLVENESVSYAVTTDGDRRYFSAGKPVKDAITGEIMGMIILDLSIPYLKSYFFKSADTYVKNFALANSHGQILFDYAGSGAGWRQENATETAGYHFDFVDGMANRLFMKRIGDIGIVLLVEADAAKAWSVWLRTRIFVYALFMGFTLISVLISYLLSTSIATPIRKLNREVSHVDEENPRRIECDTRVPEIAQLTATFNRFIDDLVRYKRELSFKTNLAAIGQTTAMIAHDVRRPLASIRAILSALPFIKDDAKTINKVIAEVDRSVSQTNTMLNDILDFSRDSKVLALADHNAQSLITASISDVLKEKTEAEVAFEYDLRHQNYLYVDGMRIVRVFGNIISNALEAMQLRGRMWFRTADDESRMTITIGNDGPLIPSDIAGNLFDPFFTHAKRGGSGLGLAICRRIVEMHGGSIRVMSRSSDDGLHNTTEFIMELPSKKGSLAVDESELIYSAEELSHLRVPVENLALEEEQNNIDAFRRLRKDRTDKSYMLIVDDEPLFRLSLRTIVDNIAAAKDSVIVVEADSAEKAMELVANNSFEYVITDIEMGEGHMNGYDFAKTIIQRYPDVCIMIHSNKRYAELDRHIVDMRSDRFMGFVPKPMTEADMLQFLARKPFMNARQAIEISTDAASRGVLVLNDDEALRIALKFMLKPTGVEVYEAESVKQAREILDGKPVALVLADINLGSGEPSGYDLLADIRSSGSAIPVYMVSGFSSDDEGDRARERGANGYFQLPLSETSIEEIRHALSHVVVKME